MTPEALVEKLHTTLCGQQEEHGRTKWSQDILDQAQCHRCLADAFREFARAALRERDARWLKAIDAYNSHCGTPLFGVTDKVIRCHTKCKGDACAPLRALLEEAGK